MSFSTKSAEMLMWFYKRINKMGLMDSRYIRYLYVFSYFIYKKYLEDSFAALIKYYPSLFKNGNILDIGANIGYTAYVFSQVIDSCYKIVAFEPEKRNFEILKQASRKHHFIHKLIPIASAVGDYNGEINLWENEAHNGDHRILTDKLSKQLDKKIKIQTTRIMTIDHYVNTLKKPFPISFIKIDVQGYEMNVCRGMNETLEKNPNAVIAFEYCPSIIKSLGYVPEDLLSFFKEKNYQFFILNQSKKFEKYDIEKGNLLLRQIKPHDYIDIVCARRDLTLIDPV